MNPGGVSFSLLFSLHYVEKLSRHILQRSKASASLPACCLFGSTESLLAGACCPQKCFLGTQAERKWMAVWMSLADKTRKQPKPADQ